MSFNIGANLENMMLIDGYWHEEQAGGYAEDEETDGRIEKYCWDVPKGFYDWALDYHYIDKKEDCENLTHELLILLEQVFEEDPDYEKYHSAE